MFECYQLAVRIAQAKQLVVGCGEPQPSLGTLRKANLALEALERKMDLGQLGQTSADMLNDAYTRMQRLSVEGSRHYPYEEDVDRVAETLEEVDVLLRSVIEQRDESALSWYELGQAIVPKPVCDPNTTPPLIESAREPESGAVMPIPVPVPEPRYEYEWPDRSQLDTLLDCLEVSIDQLFPDPDFEDEELQELIKVYPEEFWYFGCLEKPLQNLRSLIASRSESDPSGGGGRSEQAEDEPELPKVSDRDKVIATMFVDGNSHNDVTERYRDVNAVNSRQIKTRLKRQIMCLLQAGVSVEDLRKAFGFGSDQSLDQILTAFGIDES
jgi:hypothetical protein